MDIALRIFYFIALIFMAYQIYDYNLKPSYKEILKKKLQSQLNQITKNIELDRSFQHLGFNFTSQSYNLVRYSFLIIYAAYLFILQLAKDQPFTIQPFMIVIILYFLTGTHSYSLFTWLINQMVKRRNKMMEGELISFLKLYQSNKMNEFQQLQFWAFCESVSPNFKYIQYDLNRLVELENEDGIQEALEWWSSKFPDRNSVIHQIKGIILATENETDSIKAVAYLEAQNETIAKLSADYSLKKWDAIITITNITNAIPSFLIIAMFIIMIVEYLTMFKVRIN